MRKPVQPIWRGETAVILGSGPSLTRADVDFVRGKARVIAINNCYQLAPWADAFWATDSHWWRLYAKDVLPLPGLKFSLDCEPRQRPEGVHVLHKTGPGGLELDPTGLKHGHNGGYQCLGLCFHLGVTRILLLGFDLRGGHWHRPHPWHSSPNFAGWIKLFGTIAGPLAKHGVEVVNCSRDSALEVFPRMTIEQALPAREVAA